MPLFGRSVAAVHEAVDEDARDFIFAGHAQQRVEVFDVRVHPAIAEEAEKMELAGAAAFHGFEEQWLAREFAAGDELVNPRDVHLHDAPRADIQVAHFAVAHLSFGQADGGAGSLNQRVGKFLEQAVVVRLARERDGVAFGFGAIAPTVEDGENDWFWAFRWRGHDAGQNTLSKASVPFDRARFFVNFGCWAGFGLQIASAGSGEASLALQQAEASFRTPRNFGLRVAPNLQMQCVSAREAGCAAEGLFDAQ